MKIVRSVYDKKNIKNEADILSNLNHPNIVKLIDYFIIKDDLYLILEYGGLDLSKTIEKLKSNNKFLNEKTIKNYFNQLCKAINYLKDNNIIHRDIKPNNIFINKGKIKWGDFGISKILSENQKFTETVIGTPYYVSPEIVKGVKYSYKTDIWGIGITFYELIHLKLPFNSKILHKIFNEIIEKNIKFNNEFYSSDFLQILNKTIEKDPNNRPELSELLKIKPKNIISLKIKNLDEHFKSKLYIDKNKLLQLRKKKIIKPNISTTKSDINNQPNEFFDSSNKNKSYWTKKKNKMNINTPISMFSKEKIKKLKKRKKIIFKQNIIKNKIKKDLKLSEQIFNPNNFSESRINNIKQFLINKLGSEKFNEIICNMKKNYDKIELKKLLSTYEKSSDLIKLFDYLLTNNTPSTLYSNNNNGYSNNSKYGKNRNIIFSKSPISNFEKGKIGK